MSNQLIRTDSGSGLAGTFGLTQHLSAREIADTLFRQKWRILLLWSLVLAATLAYVFLTPKTFESEMTILVKDKRVDLGQEAGGWLDPTSSDIRLATEIQLLSSRELLRMVALKAGLAKQQDQVGLDVAVGRLKKALKISPVLKSSLIQVRYTDTDAKRCAQVLRLLSQFYMDMHLELHSSPGSLEFFTKEAQEAETRLKEANQKLIEFESKNNIVLLQEQKDLSLRKLVEVEAALRDARAQQSEMDLKSSKLREQIGGLGRRITTQMRTVPNQYSAERLNTMLIELQNRRTELLTKFRPDDRLIKQIEQQIADTRAALDQTKISKSVEELTDVNPLRQFAETELARTEVTGTGLSARIQALTQQARDLRADLAQLERAGPQDEILRRAVAEAEQNLTLYSKKKEDSRISQQMDRERIANVTVVDAPRVPLAANSKIGSGAPAAFLLGLVLVVALCFALGHRRNVVQTPWELETSTGIPVLATIPLRKAPPILPAPMRRPVLQLEGEVQQ